MKIAFLNQWRNAAEHQAYESMRIAGARIGHELIHCANSDEVEACRPDFVLAPASTRAKLNDFPSYGVIHDPRVSYFQTREFFNNLRTHDGFLAISDTMIRFGRDVAFSIGRDQHIGYFYTTCQRQSQSADLEAILRERRLRIAYFGTNWDKRRARLFRALSREDGFLICGPEAGWKDIDRKSYGGELDFDGQSVQTRYAECGAGLCFLSDNHLRDDVISNRVFEISSVGGLSIACDIPWLRRNFGDSLYYIDQRLPDPLLLREILAARRRMYDDPAGAMQRAQHARQVFESRFAAEVMIGNVVEFHNRLMRRRADNIARARERYWPLISVVTRCGTRPIETVRRAVEALSRQTYGRFHLIFVRHHALDLSPIDRAIWPNIERMQVVECPGGNCSKSLWAGLNAVEGDYFAVLDDDDWVFSDHFERMFEPLPHERQSKFLAYSGSVAVEDEFREMVGSGPDRRHIVRYGVQSDVLEFIAAAISTNGFVASRDLLHEGLLVDPEMDTAEDSYLGLSLFAQTNARFSYAATGVNALSGRDRISGTVHPRRFEDCLTLQTRLSGRFRPPTAPRDSWISLRDEWESRPAGVAGLHVEDGARKVHGDSTFYLATLEESKLERAAEGWHFKGSSIANGCGQLSRFRRALSLRTLAVPWAYACQLRFKRPRAEQREYLLRVELVVNSGRIGLGLLTGSGQEFHLPVASPRNGRNPDRQHSRRGYRTSGYVDRSDLGRTRSRGVDPHSRSTPRCPGRVTRSMSLPGLWEQDARMLRILDDGLGEARRRAGDAAVCRAGCFGCCLGPFPITMQDAARLQRGLDAMAAREPESAARLRERAAEAMLAMQTDFPGDWSTGVLDESRSSELYSTRYEMIPCPVLQLETGECELYEHRPVACRTFGLAVRVGEVDLTPCRLNYTGMSAAEVEERRVELHLEAIDAAGLEDGQTVVAAALWDRPPGRPAPSP